MIVYGDPQTTEPIHQLISCLESALTTSEMHSLDTLRALLVRAGQLEQAFDDAQPALDPETLQMSHAITDVLAGAFYRVRAKQDSHQVDPLLRNAFALLRQLPSSRQMVRVKIPEGFAFYALYPEQYLLSAQSWLRDHPLDDRCVVVVGLRSIGTSLSALVKAALEYEGRTVTRLTVRPHGHPFERKITLPPTEIPLDSWCIVVDEGPGASGSSFAAAAEALINAGIQQERIAFFPGHNGEPGGASSKHVRAVWRSTPRYFTPLSAVQFDGLSLPQVLAERNAAQFQSPVTAVEDFGGGLWQRAVYPSADDRPAACAPFERPKYRVTLANGEHVLWKFAGFAAAPEKCFSTADFEIEQIKQRCTAGDGVEALDQFHGFVAQRWVEGHRLSRNDVTPDLLAHVGRYIARAAGAPLSPDEQETALKHLREMLYWNTWELLGEELAEKTHQWIQIDAPLRRYGDGRLDPHEWLQTPDGRIIKTDCAGHDLDHTAVGRQSMLWDVAGALVEWGSNADLVSAAEQVSGEQFDPNSLRFYQAAYAAFRGGMCAVCAQSSDDPALLHAAERYRQALRTILEG